MKFSMLRIAKFKMFSFMRKGQESNSLHPSSKASTAKNGLITLFVDDFCSRDFQRHGKKKIRMNTEGEERRSARERDVVHIAEE